jgi:hypothetical protein
MDAQPRLLQQVIGVRWVSLLRIEEPMQLGAEAIDQGPRCGEISSLVTGHQLLEIAVHIHGYSP